MGGEGGTLERGACALQGRHTRQIQLPCVPLQVGIDRSGEPVVKHIESLGGVSGHSRAINCVRFSPSGKSCAGLRVVHHGFADCMRWHTNLPSALQGNSWPQLVTVAR